MRYFAPMSTARLVTPPTFCRMLGLTRMFAPVNAASKRFLNLTSYSATTPRTRPRSKRQPASSVRDVSGRSVPRIASNPAWVVPNGPRNELI